jgi:hypothetical protein
MWILRRVQASRALPNGYGKPFFAKFFSRRLGDETAASALADEFVDAFHQFVR